MAIEKEKLFKIIQKVSKSQDLNEDNLLGKIKNELKEKDIVEYNKFDKEFSKEYQFGIKISEEAAENWTLLHLAVACDNRLIVELLLKKKVNVNTRVKDGSKDDGPTALHIAAFYGHKDMVEQLLKDDRVNPSLKSKNKTPKDMVGDVSSKNTLVEMLETAEKNYSPRKAKDLNIKTERGGRYHLSQNNHKTQASLAVNVGNVTSAPANVIDPHLERCDSMYSDGSISGDNSLESEQSEITYTRELKNELKKSKKNIAAVVDFSSKRERELNAQLNRLTQEKKDLESEVERLSRGVNCLKEQQINAQQINAQQINAQQQLDNTLKKLSDKDSRIQELEDSDEELKRVKQKLEKAQEDLERLKGFLAENETKQETLNKLDEENKSLKQKMQDLENENTTLKDKLEENKNQHSNYVAEHEAKLEALNKQNQEKSKLQEQEIKNLKSENATLNSELDKTKTKTNEVSLEEAQKELVELKNCVAGHEARLEAPNKLNEEYQLLKQKIRDLENENITLSSRLEKIKTNKVPLEKAEKRPLFSRITYMSLITTSIAGSILSVVSGLFVLSIITTSITSALIAGGIAYTMLQPTTKLKEVDIQSPDNNKACEI